MDKLINIYSVFMNSISKLTNPELLLIGLKNPKSSGHYLYSYFENGSLNEYIDYALEGGAALSIIFLVIQLIINIAISWAMWHYGYNINWMLDLSENMVGKLVGNENVVWLGNVTYFSYLE